MLRNCIECNQVFVHAVNKLCPSCTKNRSEQFDKVKQYLRQNPKATIQEVVNETEVAWERVREFIDEGRLRIIPVDAVVHCQICGVEISSGRICVKCEQDLSDKTAPPLDSFDKRAKMHLLEYMEKQKRNK